MSDLAEGRVVLGWTALIAVLIVVLLTPWSWGPFSVESVYTNVVFVLLVLTVPIFLALRPLLMRRHWRSNAVLRQPIEGEVSDDGITWSVPGASSTRVAWQRLSRYRESEAAVLLYVGMNAAAPAVVCPSTGAQFLCFFPHYFGGPAEWQRFRKLVASKLPRK